MKRIIKISIFSILAIMSSGSLKSQKATTIHVDATKAVGHLEPFWASQIILPTEFLLTGWGNDYFNMLSKAGATRQYTRIYNQPERALKKDKDGNIYYDWSIFDEMAELILSTGSKLKIVFWGMPYEIALYPESEKIRPYGAKICISPPKDYKLWEDLCVNFTNHVIQRYGLEEVKQWTFRCWNEPDHHGFWRNADLKEYLVLYDHFAKAVKAVSSEIPIGGPALTSTGTYNNPGNLEMFLEHVAKGKNHATGEIGTPIDFIAIHTYGGSSGAGGPGRKFPEVDYLIEQQIRAADMRDSYPNLRDVSIHVEEWGESSWGTGGVAEVPTADIRNSQYGAAFLASWVERHIRMQQENDRNIRGFTFCASGYETIAEYDFMGYRTLHTKNGFYKPLLNGYKLLDKLDNELIPVQTKNSSNIASFATRSEDKISIVIVNYQHEKPFNDGLAALVRLAVGTHFDGSGNVSVNHWRIDEKHSNAYTVFKELGSPRLPNPLQIDTIKERMDLELLEAPQQIKNRKSIDLKFYLPCNSVSLIELVKNSK